MHENEISREIIIASIDIHKEFGPGLLESFYEEKLYNSLVKKGLKVERQKKIKIEPLVKDTKYFKVDLIVEEKVIVEVKAVATYAQIHTAQLLTYLKITNLKLGLLLNFNRSTLKEGIKRYVNGL